MRGESERVGATGNKGDVGWKRAVVGLIVRSIVGTKLTLLYVVCFCDNHNHVHEQKRGKSKQRLNSQIDGGDADHIYGFSSVAVLHAGHFAGTPTASPAPSSASLTRLRSWASTAVATSLAASAFPTIVMVRCAAKARLGWERVVSAELHAIFLHI
eukprot:scaffold163072_cov35-Tisochrysis_lutea.AAC.1